MTLPFVFVDTGARSGAWNMEFDAERARAVDEGRVEPMVRLFRWQPWCISLGRHQHEADIDREHAMADGIEIVRRPTGGRAILHAEELTYSVVMPSGGRGILEIYKLISEALLAGLARFAPGITLAKSQPDFQKLYREPGSVPCFSSSARYEIECGGRKLVGSAQRRIGGAVLQHGSILTGPSHLRLTDYLAMDGGARAMLRADLERNTVTLGELSGRDIPVEELRAAIRAGFEEAWDIRFTEMDGNAYIRRSQEASTPP